MSQNIFWVNQGGIQGNNNNTIGSFTNPYHNIAQTFNAINRELLSNSIIEDDIFILIKNESLPLTTNLNFNHDNHPLNKQFNTNGYFLNNKRLFIIGGINSSQNFDTGDNIKNNLKNLISPFIKSRFNSRIQQYQLNDDFYQNNNFISTVVSTRVLITGNITLVNLTFSQDVLISVQNNNCSPEIYKCYFEKQLTIINNTRIDGLNHSIPTANPSDCSQFISENNSDRPKINLCKFELNVQDESRTSALKAYCSKCDIFDNLFINNPIGMEIYGQLDTSYYNDNLNQTGINIKNCKILNSKYEGLIATFPGTLNWINKIINVECSYSKEGNGFKVRNCNLIKCRAVWNKYVGFLLLGNKYLYKCYAINNQTGILVATTTDCLFIPPYFKYHNHTQTSRSNNTIKTNFYNCAVRGSLGGSGIVFSTYNSYSLIVNCEISGNQGSLESFYDIVTYRRNYYFTGGGIKGFKNNTLCIINSSIVGNLGYGICIIDDLQKILASNNNLDQTYDYLDSTSPQGQEYNSYYIVASCERNQNNLFNVKSFEYTGSGNYYENVRLGQTANNEYRQFTIESRSATDSAHIHCSNNDIDTSKIGHIIILNSIISTNRGGQIVKLFDFYRNFPNRYFNLNSIIDSYKSDKFFTLPKNVCAWNPYKGTYEISTNDQGTETTSIGLYNMVEIYNPIPPTEGNNLIYNGDGIFRAFKMHNEIDNARDDLDLRLKTNTITFTNSIGVQTNLLQGEPLFNSSDNLFQVDVINNINNILKKKLDNSDLDQNNYNFLKLFLDNSGSYIPSIMHYKNMGGEENSIAQYRDSNFIYVNNKYYDIKNDIYDYDNYTNNYNQFLERYQIKDGEVNIVNLQKFLKDILKFDFDDLPRQVDTNSQNIGCFQKPSTGNYCNYSFNTTGRVFNSISRQFTNSINCCPNQDNDNCSTTVSYGITEYPSGLEKSLIVDFTDIELDLEQEEMVNMCQRFQNNLNTRVNTSILDLAEDLQISEDSCKIPNFDMYDFNGYYFKTRFICGKDCEFEWSQDWVRVIEQEETNTNRLIDQNYNIYYRSGNLIKIDEINRRNMRSQFGFTNNDLRNVKKLYPNECPSTAEFDYDESNSQLYCENSEISISDNINSWYENNKINNKLPLIPDGCPSFGGKKCPASNVQFASVSSESDLDLISDTSFSIQNVVDDLISNSNDVSIDSIINDIDNNQEIDPSNPAYLQNQCMTSGYLQPNNTVNNLVQRINNRNNNNNGDSPIDFKKIIMVSVIMVFIILIIVIV
jgi:hypothetical protein